MLHIAHLIEVTESLLVKSQACRLIGNLACNVLANLGIIVSAEGDVAATKCFLATNATDELLEASATAIANLAHLEISQSAAGYSKAPARMMQLLETCDSPTVLKSCCMVYKKGFLLGKNASSHSVLALA